ncbi:MAG: peptidoglycan editing factor PgeF [Hydrotalea sp.]|nr:peptidoglycan editing factor PgeF [Hydrotalea sp.]
MTQKHLDLNPMTHSLLEVPHLRHGFFDRHGGASTGVYESLNGGAGSRDLPDAVYENRQRVQRFFGAPKLLSLHQYHSAVVVRVDAQSGSTKGDGMVTNKTGIALCILTADCAPLLLVDKTKNIIGACHAGWRGAVGGVIKNTVAEMMAMGARPENINAVVGPLIGPKSYEVASDMKTDASQQHPLAEQFFTPKENGKYLFNLPGFCLAALHDCGVVSAAWLGVDTAANDHYFSNRRNKLRGLDDYGRLMSVIMLRE